MENKKVLMGGKLGDFFHSMIIPYHLYHAYGVKSDLYLSNNGDQFTHGLKRAYDELYDVIMQQEYVNSFNIYNGESVDIDTPSFRNISIYLYKLPWIDLYLKTFFDVYSPYKNISYIKYDKIDESKKGSIIFSRTNYRHVSDDLYKMIVDSYDGDIYFLYTNDEFLDVFPYKDKVIPLKVNTIEEMVLYINSCDLFVANQSAPLAIATAMNKSRMAELHGIDAPHYIGDEKYYDNFSYISAKGMYICDEHK